MTCVPPCGIQHHMLRLFALSLSILWALPGCSEPEAPPSAGLLIEGGDPERPYFHDFGIIQDGTRPTHTFRLRNTEPDPVTLHDILASCSCVVPVVRVISPTGEVTKGSLRSKDAVCVVPPSGILEVEVALDTSRIRLKNRDRLSTIRLRTDSPVDPFHTLELHVKVQQLIQATPWEIDLGEVATSEGGRGHTDVIVATQEAGVDLRTARSLSPDLTATLRSEERLGRPLWVVDVALDPGLPLGPWQGSLELIVDAPDQDPPERKVVIPVRARVVPDIVLRPRRAFIMRENVRATFTAEALVPGTRFIVESAALTGGPSEIFTTRAQPLAQDIQGRASTWQITVTQTGARPQGDLNYQLAVTLDDGTVLESALLVR